MRSASLLALVASSLTLAACAGGGGGSGTLLSASKLVADLEVCQLGQKCTNTDTGTDPGTPVDPAPGTDPAVDPSDGSPGANNGNGGNTTNLYTGDPVIALEAGTVVSDKATPSLGKLTLTAGTPNLALLEVDTNTANNNKWAVPKEMDEYVVGTNASGGVGLGGTYKEYRAYQNSNTDAYDEVLQVWTFGDSYAAQYRDETSGKETADKQAWAFGGLTTGSVTPGNSASGTATYEGRFGSTAITRNWKNSTDPTQQADFNNSWRVNGNATATVNFNTNAVSATLDPSTWETEADFNNYSGFVVSVNANNAADPNHNGFMASNIILDGTLTKTATSNKIAGSATMDTADGWLSDGGNNPFYGAIYGANGQDITGVFATTAVNPYPIGGDFPLNNPARGYINHSGAFNGDCTNAGGVCPTITP